MASKCIVLLFATISILIISSAQVKGSWLLDIMHPDWENLRALEKRRLLNEVEVLDDEEELEELEEEKLRRRSEEYESINNQLRALADYKRKREYEILLRQTPEPAIRRLRMTPPPNVPEPQFRLKQTPLPVEHHRRPTPGPDEVYNLVNGPRRETPRPLRLTPVPGNVPVKPNVPDELIDDSVRRPLRPTPIPVERNEMLWKRILARREKVENAKRESQRRSVYYP